MCLGSDLGVEIEKHEFLRSASSYGNEEALILLVIHDCVTVYRGAEPVALQFERTPGVINLTNGMRQLHQTRRAITYNCVEYMLRIIGPSDGLVGVRNCV